MQEDGLPVLRLACKPLPLSQPQVVVPQSPLRTVVTNLARSLLLYSLEVTDVWLLRQPWTSFSDLHSYVIPSLVGDGCFADFL